MEMPQFFPSGKGLELTRMERLEDQLVLHVTTTSPSALCSLCQQPATRLHSRYRRGVKGLPCAGQRVRLILRVRKFFCDTAYCERLPHLVAPWAQMTDDSFERDPANDRVGDLRHTRCTTGRTPGNYHVLDDFACRRGRTFGTVVIDLEAHQIIDLLPDRQAETASAWMATHPEITYVSRGTRQRADGT